MRRTAFLGVLPLLLLALGCATLSRTPSSCPPGFEEVLASPTLLRERYDQAYEDKQWDTGYRYLTLIHILHPDSAEDRELFTTAASLFKSRFLRYRVKGPGSVWVLSEPAFMIQWILQILEQREEFPEVEFTYLFRSMPKDFFDQFMVTARTRRVHKEWDIQATEDNGKVVAITGTRVDQRGAEAAAPSADPQRAPEAAASRLRRRGGSAVRSARPQSPRPRAW